jgi:hypothetical protein
MDVTDVGNSSLMGIILDIMKELTMKKNPMDVSNVGKTNQAIHIQIHVRTHAGEKRMEVSSVRKPLIEPVTFRDIVELTL